MGNIEQIYELPVERCAARGVDAADRTVKAVDKSFA